MIPILYDKTGNVKIGELTNCIECLVEEERNGLFEVSLIYPTTDTLFNSLEEENIIVCNANDTLLNQKFRIYMTRKLMSNKIEVFARHISFDLAYDYINSIDIEKQSCEYALNTIFRNSQFSTHYKGYSDIINAQDYKISKVNCIEAIGGTSGSILDTFGTGAEILRDNTNIHVLNKRGHDNGVSIEYAKNLIGFELEEDYSELITRIVPFATYTDNETNEEILVEANPVDSDLISNYSHPYISYMDFSEKFEDEEILTTEKLVNLAKKYFENNECDKPKQNFKIEFIPLSKCVGYEGIEDNISLCDTVTIKDTRFNINTKAKVIKTVFNVLKNRYESMELGEPRTTLGDIISSNIGGEDGKQGPPGPQGPPGKDGSIGDFPNSLPSTPVLSANVYGFASIELNWTYENKVYYNYELYGSKTKDFTPNTFDLIHAGQTSSYLFQAKPNETWYFRVCAVNSHGERTAFSSQVVVNTTKIDDLSNYVEKASIGSALIGSLNADVINSGTVKGNYIDAKQLSVTNGNGIRTLDIDSFGNVNLNVNSLKISSSSVATETYASNQANSSLNSSKTYTDSVGRSTLTSANTHANNVANTAQTNAINSAKDYTNTKITDIKAEIKLTTDSISQRVSSNESTTSTLTTKVNTAQSTADSATNKINNLQVGGRNLIKQSVVTGNNVASSSYDKNTATWTLTANAGAGGTWGAGLVINGNSVRIPYGKTYVLSFEIKVPRACSWNIDINNYVVTGSSWSGNDNDNGSARATSSKSLIANQWIKCWSRISNTDSRNTDKVDIYDNSLFGVVMQNETSSMTYQIRNVQGEIGNIPSEYTPAPEDVQSQIDTAQSTADSATTKANNAQSTANIANSTANTANNTANTNKNNIATLQTTVTTTNNKVSTIETNLSGITSRVSATETNLTTTTNKLNNLQVGSTNLLVGSSDVSKFTDYWVNNGCSILNSYYKGSRIYKVSNAWQDYGFKLPSLSSELATGKKYTYSVYVKSSSSSYLPEVYLYGGGWNTKLGTATTSWQRFTFKGTFSDLTTQLRIEPTTNSSDSAKQYLMVAGIQLEEGEVLTDYSPTPKDSEITISNLTTRVSNAESKLTKDSLTTTIGSHYTTSTDVNNAITSKGYATTSQVQQTKNELTATFRESGGYNRVRNGAFLTGDLTHWSNWGSCTKVVENSTDSGLGKVVKITTTGTNQGIQQTITGLAVNKKYTLSALVWASSGVGAVQVYDGSSYPSKTTTTTGIFEKLSVPFTAKATSVLVQLGRHGGGSNGTYYYTGVILEEGTTETPWSPHPDEVYSGITKIDRNGIQVSQSNISTTTKMNASGFYINKGGTDVFKVDSGGLAIQGNITGSTITGSKFMGSGTGNRVCINNGDYEVQTGTTTKGFFGLRTLDDDGREIPRLALGSSGLNKNSHNYFAVTHYPANNNPLNANQTYADMTYRTHKYTTSDTSGDISNIRMLDDGDIHLAPVRNLIIKSSFTNGYHNTNTDETTLAEFGTYAGDYTRYMETACIRRDGTSKGLILANYNSSGYGALVRVCIDSSNYKFFAPLDSNKDISLGSPSYLWQRVCASNGTINTSDRNLKNNVEYIQETQNPKARKSNEYSIKDMYDFVKDDLSMVTYTMKDDEEQKLKYGFIAQDIINTKVGENIVYQENSEEGSFLGYDTMNYTSALAGALKQAINEIEKLKEEIKVLKGGA